MINLIFDVTETEVILREKTQTVTSGNVKQIKCRFNLNKAFDGLIIRAVFNGQFQNVINGECYAPMLDEGKCAIGVYGYILNDNNQYETIVSPAPTNIVVPKGSYDKRNVQNNNAPPSELEAYYNSIKKLIDSIEPVQVDSELSTESSNAIANKAVAKILSSGNLIGIERISSLEDFEQLEKKYENVPVADNKYMLLLVTEDIYSGEDLVLGEGLIVLTPTDEYKLTCNKEFEEFKKAVEMNFNLFFQALGNYATREKLEQVKTDLLRSIELLQSQTEQKISTTNKNVLQLTARVDELESDLRLIYENTVSEEVNSVIINKDINNNAFSLNKVRVYMLIPKGNVSEYIIFKKGSVIEGTAIGAGAIIGQNGAISATAATHLYCEMEVSQIGISAIVSKGLSQTIMSAVTRGFNPDTQDIDSLIIRTNSLTNVIPAGTQIKVWGC